MKTILSIILLLGILLPAKAQVGIGTTTPANSAALEIKDSTKGILIPRLTMVQRLAIQNPAEGLMVYQKDSTKGYWYFEGIQWKNIYTYTGNGPVGGKNKLVLSDTISNAQAQAIIAADFGPNTQELYILGCSQLTSVSLPALKSATNIFITDNPNLTSVNLSNLQTCAGHMYFVNCPLLTTVNLSSLQNIILNTFTSEIALYISNTKITDIALPVLKNVVGIIDISGNAHSHTINFPVLEKTTYLAISANDHLTGISIPLLAQCDIISMGDNTLLTALSLPSLASVGRFIIQDHPALTSISFPSLTRFTTPDLPYALSQSIITRCRYLTNIELGNLLQFSNLEFEVSETKIGSPVVNYLLNKFVSIAPALTNKSIRLAGQQPAAPPTGQGIIDKATLVANGNMVSTD